MTAPYERLLRVPGIGVRSAKRIVNARRFGGLDYDSLRRMGVVLKRAHYFITCRGKQMLHTKMDEQSITRGLMSADAEKNWKLAHPDDFRQMSLFDDFHIQAAAVRD